MPALTSQVTFTPSVGRIAQQRDRRRLGAARFESGRQRRDAHDDGDAVRPAARGHQHERRRPGSLRQAILDSNADTGDRDTIVFNIPGSGVHTITPLTALPLISQPVVIDGTTQPGFAGTPLDRVERQRPLASGRTSRWQFDRARAGHQPVRRRGHRAADERRQRRRGELHRHRCRSRTTEQRSGKCSRIQPAGNYIGGSQRRRRATAPRQRLGNTIGDHGGAAISATDRHVPGNASAT